MHNRAAMARPRRLQFPGAHYHITGRGNARGDIFIDDEDRQVFLQLFGKMVRRTRWEGQVSGITRRLWLPGLVGMIAPILMLVTLVVAGVPRQFHSWALLSGTPFVGALGAYLSRRAGGTPRSVVASGLFPAAALLVAMMIVVVLGAMLGWRVPGSNYMTMARVMARPP